MNKYLAIALCVSLAVVAFLSNRIHSIKEDRDRLKGNQTALLSDVEYYKSESGRYASSVQALQLSKSELEKHCANLKKTVDDLNLKVKRIQSASTTATKTEVEIKTEVRDSIVYRDRLDTLKRITFKDPWVRLDGTIEKDTFTGEINVCDTLVQIVHRVPKRFWFIKWGTKAIRQEIRTSSPYTKIVYSEYIELKKKKR